MAGAMFENATDDNVANEPKPRLERADVADVAPVPPSPIARVPVIDEAPKSTASSVDSITNPPFEFLNL